MRKIYLSIMKLMIITVIVSLSILIFPLLAQDQKPYVSETGLFENSYCDEDRKPGLTDMLRWKFSYHILQKPFISDNYEYTIMPPEFINLPSSIYSGVITWVGHSTFIIQVDGINIITDPVWSERVGFFSGRIGHQHYAPPGVPWKKLPPVDVVVISHSHYDHLDKPTIVRLYEDFRPLFLVPAGVKEIIEGWGVDNVKEFYWWDSYNYQGVEFIATPAQHQSQRSLLDKNTTLWSGWGIRAADVTFYFAGDTGYYDGFGKIRDRLGPIDVAMLPIGAYKPRWYNGAYHLDPEEAVRAFQDLGARFLAAMHWGTFDKAEENLGDPPRELQYQVRNRRLRNDIIWIFAFGESRAIPPREKEAIPFYSQELLK